MEKNLTTSAINEGAVFGINVNLSADSIILSGLKSVSEANVGKDCDSKAKS